MMAMAIMDFVQRFQALQVQRDTGDELIKVGNNDAPQLQHESDDSAAAAATAPPGFVGDLFRIY